MAPTQTKYEPVAALFVRFLPRFYLRNVRTFLERLAVRMPMGGSRPDYIRRRVNRDERKELNVEQDLSKASIFS